MPASASQVQHITSVRHPAYEIGLRRSILTFFQSCGSPAPPCRRRSRRLRIPQWCCRPGPRIGELRSITQPMPMDNGTGGSYYKTHSCCFGCCGLVNRNHCHRRRGTPWNGRIPQRPRRRSVWGPHHWWRPRNGADLQFLQWLHCDAVDRDARLAGEPWISVPLNNCGAAGRDRTGDQPSGSLLARSIPRALAMRRPSAVGRSGRRR